MCLEASVIVLAELLPLSQCSPALLRGCSLGGLRGSWPSLLQYQTSERPVSCSPLLARVCVWVRDNSWSNAPVFALNTYAVLGTSSLGQVRGAREGFGKSCQCQTEGKVSGQTLL